MKVRFSGQEQAGFFADTRKQVDAYFKENNIGKRLKDSLGISKIMSAME